MTGRRLTAQPAGMGKVFISHAAKDRPIAQWIGDVLHEHGSPEVFLASRVGDITSGDGWFETIVTELEHAASHLVLLTRNSIKSLWVAFEAGGIYFARRPRVFLCAGGLRKAEAPHPFADL